MIAIKKVQVIHNPSFPLNVSSPISNQRFLTVTFTLTVFGFSNFKIKKLTASFNAWSSHGTPNLLNWEVIFIIKKHANIFGIQTYQILQASYKLVYQTDSLKKSYLRNEILALMKRHQNSSLKFKGFFNQNMKMYFDIVIASNKWVSLRIITCLYIICT